jgi:hypothetical protein
MRFTQRRAHVNGAFNQLKLDIFRISLITPVKLGLRQPVAVVQRRQLGPHPPASCSWHGTHGRVHPSVRRRISESSPVAGAESDGSDRSDRSDGSRGASGIAQPRWEPNTSAGPVRRGCGDSGSSSAWARGYSFRSAPSHQIIAARRFCPVLLLWPSDSRVRVSGSREQCKVQSADQPAAAVLRLSGSVSSRAIHCICRPGRGRKLDYYGAAHSCTAVVEFSKDEVLGALV